MKTVVGVLFFLLSIPSVSEANDSPIIRVGAGSCMFTNFAHPNVGGNMTLHARFERFTPFELEMGYFVARGIEIVLLIDIIRSRHINWHLFDFGLYFPMDTRPFSNLDIDRKFDIVVGTGLDIPIPRLRNFFVSLNLRFFIPDPERIGAYASRRGRNAVREIEENFTLDDLMNLEDFVDRSSDHVLSEFRGGFRDIFRDVGVNLIFAVGIKYYFN